MLTNLEAVSLDCSQEGGEPNLTLQVQADLVIPKHQPLSCQLHRQTYSMSESVWGYWAVPYTHIAFLLHNYTTGAEEFHTQSEQSMQQVPERKVSTG